MLHSPGGSDTLSPAALGSLTSSLTSLQRTVDEYANLARHEPNAAKQEKALDRVRTFRSELGEYRAQLDSLRSARDDAAHASNRAELLGRRPYATATPENPYASGGSSSLSGGPGGGGGGGGYGLPTMGSTSAMSLASGDEAREAHALREQSFFASTNSALDEYIARGQAVLGDLNEQREMLKNTQRSLYNVANTLGISGDTIRMIERRARQDKWIFWAGVLVFFLFVWLCLHFLR